MTIMYLCILCYSEYLIIFRDEHSSDLGPLFFKIQITFVIIANIVFPFILYQIVFLIPNFDHAVTCKIQSSPATTVLRVKKALDERNIAYDIFEGDQCRDQFGSNYAKTKFAIKLNSILIIILFHEYISLRPEKPGDVHTDVYIKPVTEETIDTIHQLISIIDNCTKTP